jgi:hypothetical protein
MGWLIRHNWLWSLLAFLLGAAITWFLLVRREQSAPALVEEQVEEREEVLVGAAVGGHTFEQSAGQTFEPAAEGPVAVEVREESQAPVVPEPAFSRRMEPERVEEPTLFDHEPDDETTATEPQVRADVPPGRYGEGSADAVPHQGPPDGFTIKGNSQSMLFHTPDSPYYGRTKPQVWFRTEADAERAGFTKYARRPRKSTNPRD